MRTKSFITESNVTISKAAELTQRTQPYVSKLLALLTLNEEIQALVRAGNLDVEKAFILSSETDPTKQQALLHAAPALSREQLRRKAHSNGEHVELKTTKATFPLASGASVLVRGVQMTLADAIGVLEQVTKELRVAQRQSLDISTAQKVFADKARSTS